MSVGVGATAKIPASTIVDQMAGQQDSGVSSDGSSDEAGGMADQIISSGNEMQGLDPANPNVGPPTGGAL
jgi:hypothetical protein